MPRHFVRRLYGPYFPYDHNPHDSKNDNNYIENKIQIIFRKIKNRLTFKK